jgi:hypothetical protein
VGGEEAEISRAGVLMAGDPVLVDDVERAVLDGLPAPAALEAATARHATAIAALGDETPGRTRGGTSARSAAGRCGWQAWRRILPPRRPPMLRPSLIAEDLGPADVAELGADVAGSRSPRRRRPRTPPSSRAGSGCRWSWAGPECSSAPRASSCVDGDAGRRRSRRGRRAARGRRARAARPSAPGAADRALPAVTLDGRRVRVLVNAATRAELDAGLAAGAEGSGCCAPSSPSSTAELADGGAAPRALAPVLARWPAARHRARARLRRRQDAAVPRRHARARARAAARAPDALDAQLRAIVAPAATELRVLLPMVEPRAGRRGPRRAPAGVSLGAMIETRGAVARAPRSRPRGLPLDRHQRPAARVLGSDRFAPAPPRRTTRACSPRWRPPPRARRGARRSRSAARRRSEPARCRCSSASASAS